MGTEVVLETAEKKWWDWVAVNEKRSFVPDDAPSETKQAYLDDLVKRCVLVDSLSPLVTYQILLAAIDQFATVLAVKLLRNPLVEARPSTSGVVPNHSGMAVVELENPQKAEVVLTQLQEYMLMVGGMPRPARAALAQPLMLVDHPYKRHTIAVKFVDSTDRNRKRKRKSLEHLKAANYLRELQQREEEDLHNKHGRMYKDLKEKYFRIKSNMDINNLRNLYGMPDRQYRR